MKHLKDYTESRLKNADGVLAVLRTFLGVILLWKAYEFVMDRGMLMEIVADAGDWCFAPVIWVHYIICAHFFGGVCLLFGAVTRFACIIQLPILLGAVFYVHLPALMQLGEIPNIVEMNMAIVTLVLLCFYSIRGSGTHSLDFQTVLEEEGDDDIHHHHIHHA